MKKKIIFISALILLLIFFPGCKKKENVDVVGKTFYLNEDNEIDFDTYIIFDMDYCGINYYTGPYDSYFFHYVYEIKGNNIYIYFKDFTIEGIINDSNMIISYQEKDYYFCESFLTPLPPKFMDLQGVYYLVNKESLSVLDFTLDFTNYLFDKFISMIDDTRHACQILGYTNEEIIIGYYSSDLILNRYIYIFYENDNYYVTLHNQSKKYLLINDDNIVIENDCTYLMNYDNSTCSLLSCDNKEISSLTIPEKVDNCVVDTIYSTAFDKTYKLEEIVLPKTIVNINDDAFSRCAIKKADIPATACKAVRSDHLKEVIINSGKSIPSQAFLRCSSLTNIQFNCDIESIENEAFKGCTSLTELTIPDTVKSIGGDIFHSCTNLSKLKLSNAINIIPARMCYQCQSLTEIDIPQDVVLISTEAFYECKNLTNVSFSPNIVTIEDSAFYSCDILSSLNLPRDLKRICNSCFFSCTRLANVEFPNGIEEIDASAFENCINLTTIVLPESLKQLGSYVFSGCSRLRKITINANDVNHLYNTFSNTYFEYVEIPSCLTSILPQTIRDVKVNGDHIESGSFYNCYNLTNVILPNNMTTIPTNCFYYCHYLRNLELPNSIISIESNSFVDCPNLKNINIPNQLQTIGNYCFVRCSQLKEFYLPDSLVSIGFGSFEDENGNQMKLYTHNDSMVVFDPKFLLYTDVSDIFIIDDITYIIQNDKVLLTNYSGNAQTIIVPSTVKYNEQIYNVEEIGKYAFYNCSSIVDVTISLGISTIDSYAFASCYFLKRIFIPNSVSIMESYVFDQSPLLIVYCEAKEKPADWQNEWDNSVKGKVYWGQTNPIE